MNLGGVVSLLVKPAGLEGEALEKALRDAGFSVRIAPTVFDVVTEAHRAGGALKHLFVDVDHWGPAEFRLLPLVRREWPATTIVACHSPAFAYKGRLAELAGADAVLGSTEEILQFVEGLAAPAEPAPAPPSLKQAPVSEAVAETVEPPPAPPQAGSPPPSPEAARPPASPLQSIPMIQPPTRPPEPASAPPADRPAPAPPGSVEPGDENLASEDGAEGEVIGTIELTEEELRMLLGEDEEA